MDRGLLVWQRLSTSDAKNRYLFARTLPQVKQRTGIGIVTVYNSELGYYIYVYIITGHFFGCLVMIDLGLVATFSPAEVVLDSRLDDRFGLSSFCATVTSPLRLFRNTKNVFGGEIRRFLYARAN